VIRNPLFFAIVIISLSCLHCSSVSQTNRPPLKLSQVELLKIGRTTRQEVLTILGPPKAKMLFDAPKNIEAWNYYDGDVKPVPRISLSFDEASGVLLGKTWNVLQNEPESNLSQLEKFYPTSNFTHRDAPWTNPHSYPDEEFYEDKEKGIQITFSYARQKVQAISWLSSTDRAVSSDTQK